jgi:hypothetical protein
MTKAKIQKIPRTKVAADEIERTRKEHLTPNKL